MKTTIHDLTAEELFTWIELKDADIQYDLFDPNKQVPKIRSSYHRHDPPVLNN